MSSSILPLIPVINRFKKAAELRSRPAQKGSPGMLAVHYLCLNESATVHTADLLRLVLQTNEEGAQKTGGVHRKLPVQMLCEGRQLNTISLAMFRRLVEASKESVKGKGTNKHTLLHKICFSSRAVPHCEFSVELVRLILEAHKRAPEAASGDGQRPLHRLAASEVLTQPSVIICSML